MWFPADVQPSDGQVRVDQSQLTGESLPLEHQAESTSYTGSLVSRGEATGVVSATGERTYFGKTAELVRVAGGTGFAPIKALIEQQLKLARRVLRRTMS